MSEGEASAAMMLLHGPGDPSPCAGCGGDGVQIDDDPESTRQIVSTCGECRGSGSAVPEHAAPEPTPDQAGSAGTDNH